MINRSRFQSVLRFVSALSIGLLLALGALPLKAQFTSAVEGAVTDSTDAVVPEVDLTLTNIDTGVTLTSRSNAAGRFRFIDLGPGRYRLKANKTGFRPVLQDNIVLESGRVQSVPIKMEVGAVTQEVTVQADVIPVETTNPKISVVVTNEYIQGIPIAQRNIYNVVGLAPGITGFTNQLDTDSFNTIVGVRANANGQRVGSNGFYVDGSPVNDMADGGGAKLTPNPDAVQEVLVTTNDYSAQWGKNSGILTRVVTKTGTNQIHGTLFWYHRDNALQARTYLQNTISPITGRILPAFRRNEGGFSIGAPIKKDRTFVFATFDKLRSSNAVSNLQTVETPDLVNWMSQNYPNTLSTKLVKQFKPLVPSFQSYQTVADLTTPAGSCAGTNSLGIPCSLRATGTGVFSATNIHDGMQWNVRLDQLFRGGGDRLYGNYFRTTYGNFNPGVRDFSSGGFAAYVYPTQDNVGVNYTHTFSASVFNETSFGFYRTENGSPCNNCQVPPIGVTGISGFGAGWAPAVFITRDFNWQDILSWNRGRHFFKTGFHWASDQEPLAFTGPLERPFFSFPNIFDFIQDSPLSESGINFDPRTGSTKINNNRDFRFAYYAAFAQDDWKPKPNLALNLGIRWEYNTNPIDKTDLMTNIKFGPGSTMIERVRSMSVGITPALLDNTHKAYFAPRLGLAWDPTKTGKMSIRSGLGMFYESYTTKTTFDRNQLNPPLFANISVRRDDPTGPKPIFALARNNQSPFDFPLPGLAAGLNPAGGPINGRASVAGVDPNLKFAYALNWFTGVQYALSPKWVVEANYLGSRGNHLYTHIDRNRCSGCGTARINPYFATFEYIDNAGWSIYHGATLQVRHLFGGGLSMQAAYTIGKALDVMNSAGGGVSGAYGNVIDAYDLRRQYGLSEIDVPQRLATSFVYNLPGPASGNRLVKAFLGGWEISGIVTLQKGLPQTITDSRYDYNNDTVFFDVPDAPLKPFPGWSRSDYLRGTFKVADFPVPLDPATGRPSREGNLGRNTYRGPGFAQTDLALHKNSKLPWFTSEKANLQLRFEAFNALNRVNPSDWNTNLSSGSFGRTTGSRIPRTLQISARIIF